MSSTDFPTSETQPDQAIRIETDLACVECGYNLRTLARTATCPECGIAVVVSARGDRLASAPQAWVHALAHGAWWLRAAVVIALPVVYLGVALSSYGIWVLTLPQPGRTEPSVDRGYRLAARWLTIFGSFAVSVLTLGGLIAVAATDQRLLGDWNLRLRAGGGAMDSLPAFDAVYLTAHAVYVLGLLASWRYLGILAQRVPDDELATAWRGLVRAWIVSVLFLAIVSGGSNILIGMGILPGGSVSFWLPLVISLMFMVVLLALWVATMRVTGRQVWVLKGEMQETQEI
ncbi:MAG: hypothetical protein R3C45_00810 [Phycisphaerales bacterium]